MDPLDVVARTPSNSSSGASIQGAEDETRRLRLISILGGETCYYDWKTDKPNIDAVNIFFDIIYQCRRKFSNIKVAFSQIAHTIESVNREDFDAVNHILETFNAAATTMAKLWKGATNPEALSWSQDRADVQLLTSICSTVFNSAVSSVKSLNSHYTPFSSEVYGETKYEQMQKIIDQLKFKESDVFVDLGSGVGHLVLYVAGGTKVRKAVGIEKATVPANYASKMKGEFTRWMRWYNKKSRPFDLIAGDFLDPQFKKLITEEATIVFINNYAFNPDLEMRIKRELLADMREGTRIISTKAYAVGTKEINHRLLNDVEAILDVRELDAVPCPTSWTDKHVPYFLHTVNRVKLENYFRERAHGKSSSQSTENSRRASMSSKSSHSSSREGSAAMDRDTKPPAGGTAVFAPPVGPSTSHDDVDDDDSAYGPTTRHKWKVYVSDMDRKKRKASPSSGTPRWNEADREYVPPGMKKPRSNSNASKASVSSGHIAAAAVVTPKVPKSSKRGPGRPRARVSDEARAGMDQLHSMIASPQTLPIGHGEGAGLIRVNLGGSLVVKTKSESPSLPDQRAAALPDGAIVLDPSNPMDRILISIREGMMGYVDHMPTEEFKRAIAEDIQRESIRRNELLEKIRERESSVSTMLAQGVGYLRSRLMDLGMSDVETPSELLTCSKRIVAQHKELTQSVSSREAEVACLEGKTRCLVPTFGEVLLDRLHLLDECPDTEKDKYTWLIHTVAAETGNPVPRLESDNESCPSSSASLVASIGGSGGVSSVDGVVLSPGGPRRRPRPRNGPGRKGRSEESSEEVDRKVQEIVQAAMRVDHAAKEKERKARGAAATEKPQRKNTGSGASGPLPSDAMSVPLPRSAPFSSTASLMNPSTLSAMRLDNVPDSSQMQPTSQQLPVVSALNTLPAMTSYSSAGLQ